MGGLFYLGDGFGFAGLVLLTDQHTGQPVAADPWVPVHACCLPPVVVGYGRFQDTLFYLSVDTLTDIGREGIQLLLQHIACPYNQTGCLGIKQVNLLYLLQGDAFAIVGGDAPPGFFAKTTDSIDDVVHKPALALYNLGHDEGSQMAALLKTDTLVVYAVTGYLVLSKNSPGQSRPRFAQILFAIYGIALLHLLRDGVAPERILCLR